MYGRRRELLALLPKHGIGMEIGVWQGKFSRQILRFAKPEKLYLVDPWIIQDDPVHKTSWYGDAEKVDMDRVYEGVTERLANQIAEGTVVVIRKRSVDALPTFPDDHFDFIYIDGDHEYSAARSDCFLAFSKVKPGGLICGDDYAIRGFYGDGVVRAFHELIAAGNVILRYVGNMQIVLQKL